VSLFKYLLTEANKEKSYEEIRDFSDTISGKSIVKYEESYDMPILAKNKSNWELLDNPERMTRTFNFDNLEESIYFINELYKYQFDINHHCKIIINHLEVNVETYTHGFEGITVLDKKITKFSDDLYGDVQYFKNKK
jgi:pterin-4a-carbinolamine dehydratase